MANCAKNPCRRAFRTSSNNWLRLHQSSRSRCSQVLGRKTRRAPTHSGPQKSPAKGFDGASVARPWLGLTTAFAQQPEEAPERVTPYSTVLGPSECALKGRLRHPIRAKVFGTMDGKKLA
jgi:hypothetical protein